MYTVSVISIEVIKLGTARFFIGDLILVTILRISVPFEYIFRGIAQISYCHKIWLIGSVVFVKLSTCKKQLMRIMHLSI